MPVVRAPKTRACGDCRSAHQLTRMRILGSYAARPPHACASCTLVLPRTCMATAGPYSRDATSWRRSRRYIVNVVDAAGARAPRQPHAKRRCCYLSVREPASCSRVSRVRQQPAVPPRGWAETLRFPESGRPIRPLHAKAFIRSNLLPAVQLLLAADEAPFRARG